MLTVIAMDFQHFFPLKRQRVFQLGKSPKKKVYVLAANTWPSAIVGVKLYMAKRPTVRIQGEVAALALLRHTSVQD